MKAELRIWAACEHSVLGEPRVCAECLSKERARALNDAIGGADLRALVDSLQRCQRVIKAAEALVAIPNISRRTYLGEWECGACGGGWDNELVHAPDCAWVELVEALK